MNRPTIKDIARQAGVSPGAVSFALNDRPGVSEETRARIKQVAADLGWTRSAAAAALSGRRAKALGMVMQRNIGDDSGEAFIMRFIHGIQQVLNSRGYSFFFQMAADGAEEQKIYRTWWGEGRVDGVVLVRPVLDDGRPELLAELGMPGVVVGAPQGERLASICADEVVTTRMLVEHFVSLGHKDLAYVTGPQDRQYIIWRTEAFREACEELGVESRVVHVPVEDDVRGLQASQRLVRGRNAPTAVIYDNELLALGAMAACHDAGVQVGKDICVASFEDSSTCRMLRPAITALRRRSEDLGEIAAQLVLDIIDGGKAASVIGPLPELAVRASSGRPRGNMGAMGRVGVTA